MFEKSFCNICGKATEYLSKVDLSPSYESIYDMEGITLEICGGCMDGVFDFIEKRRYNAIKDYVGDETDAMQIQEMLNSPDIAATVEVFNVADVGMDDSV